MLAIPMLASACSLVESASFVPAEESAPMGALAQGVLAEVNRVRRDPTAYATHLESYREYFEGTLLNLPREDNPLRTVEGVEALEEAIEVARGAAAAPLLTAAEGLNQAARDHAEYLRDEDLFQHEGEGGSSPFDRMRLYGEIQGAAAENIGSGTEDPEYAVFLLFVDDDVPDRGHRDTILNPAFHRAGVGCAEHPRYRFACVMGFATEYGAYSD